MVCAKITEAQYKDLVEEKRRQETWSSKACSLRFSTMLPGLNSLPPSYKRNLALRQGQLHKYLGDSPNIL